MSNHQTKTLLATVEHQLIAAFRPTMLNITGPDDFNAVVIIIASTSFKYKSIQERIHDIFNLLSVKNPDVINKWVLLIQAYNNEEIYLMLDNVYPIKD